MEENIQEDSALLLIKEETKTNTSRKIMRLTETFEQINIKCYSTVEMSIDEMISSGEFKFDYVFIYLNYDNFVEIVSKLKCAYKGISIVIIYDKNTENVVEKLSDIEKQYGIKDMLEKTGLGLAALKNLVLNIKAGKAKTKRDDSVTPEKYTYIKKINEGASGVVDLYIDHDSNNFIAIKRIKTDGMTMKERNKVKQEVELMRSLRAPTIIEFIDSHVENDTRYIYMEYADALALDEKIREIKHKGLDFSTDQILDWLCEIFIALYVLNKNNIMHRDIKAENILLKTEKVNGEINLICKLSDLGISRKFGESDLIKTYLGTPYYVSPEIVCEQDYTFNTDIWSLGVVLYEMICGNKPFDKISAVDLYNSIKSDDYPPLNESYDIKLIYLVSIMLRKNPERRYSLEEIMSLDFVNEKIRELINKFSWQDKIPFINDFMSLKKTACFHTIDIVDKSQILLLQESFKILENCIYTHFKKSMLSGKILNSITGEDLLISFKDNSSYKNEEEFFKNLLDNQILIPVSNHTEFEDSKNAYYIFSFDDLAKFDNPIILTPLSDELNLCKKNKNSIDLVSLSQFILNEGLLLIDKMLNSSNKINLLTSVSYVKFICGISLFKEYDILKLDSNERLAFLLNLYQIMFIHHILKSYIEKTSDKNGLLSLFKNQIAINYQFSELSLNNLELKHVVFRNNKKPFGNYVRLVSSNDKKTQLLHNYSDLRPLLLLSEFGSDVGNYLKYKFQIFETKDIDYQLNEFVMNFIFHYISMNDYAITIPSYLENYFSDFGSNGVLDFFKFIAKIYNANKEKDPIRKFRINEENFEFFNNTSQLIKKINNNNIKVIYE